MGKWIYVRPDLKVRRCEDGQWEGVRTEYVADTLKSNEERHKESLETPKKARMTSDAGTLIAVMPPMMAHEMDVKCGHDPEKRRAFLRDHPELLTCGKGDAHLPPRRLTIFPK